MRQLHYTLQFHTPAFLGNAEQSGQWRTPPFKAQLRQWWRVAYAASNQFRVNVEAMRQEEGHLFGNAWLENDFSKSKVRIRLRQWSDGKLKKDKWEQLPTVPHAEVKAAVSAGVYLGFGPVTTSGLKANAAIQAGEENAFSIAFPDDDHSALIEQALALMSGFGTVGGRSRNGWGSYSLHPGADTSALPAFTPTRPWREALRLDWPHAIGSDTKGPLIWQTRPFANWQTLMKELAIIKIGLRTQFKFPQRQPDGQIHECHWLSYPVTRHTVKAWSNARLPNSLRFKIRPAPDGQLVGVIFHMPCLPPASFQPDPLVIADVWQKVHAFLDSPDRHLTRISA